MRSAYLGWAHAGADFARDLWPLIDKELGWAHYHRLFTARPAATRVAWDDFAEKYAAAAPRSEEPRPLLATAVPDPADRLDLAALDSPLAGTVLRHRCPLAGRFSGRTTSGHPGVLDG